MAGQPGLTARLQPYAPPGAGNRQASWPQSLRHGDHHDLAVGHQAHFAGRHGWTRQQPRLGYVGAQLSLVSAAAAFVLRLLADFARDYASRSCPQVRYWCVTDRTYRSWYSSVRDIIALESAAIRTNECENSRLEWCILVRVSLTWRSAWQSVSNRRFAKIPLLPGKKHYRNNFDHWFQVWK